MIEFIKFMWGHRWGLKPTKLPARKYRPVWLSIISALAHLVDGVLSLLLIPFGRASYIGGLVSGYIIERAMDIRKKERGG